MQLSSFIYDAFGIHKYCSYIYNGLKRPRISIKGLRTDSSGIGIFYTYHDHTISAIRTLCSLRLSSHINQFGSCNDCKQGNSTRLLHQGSYLQNHTFGYVRHRLDTSRHWCIVYASALGTLRCSLKRKGGKRNTISKQKCFVVHSRFFFIKKRQQHEN